MQSSLDRQITEDKNCGITTSAVEQLSWYRAKIKRWSRTKLSRNNDEASRARSAIQDASSQVLITIAAPEVQQYFVKADGDKMWSFRPDCSHSQMSRFTKNLWGKATTRDRAEERMANSWHNPVSFQPQHRSAADSPFKITASASRSTFSQPTTR